MHSSSISIIPLGRKDKLGGPGRLLLAGFAVGWLNGAALAADPQATALNEAQIHAARIRAMTTVCEEASPTVAAHVEQAYVDWLERNPMIAQEALHTLHFGPGAEARLAAYEALRQQLEEELRRELAAKPQDFAERCNAFVDDLAAGELGYPKAAPVRRPG